MTTPDRLEAQKALLYLFTPLCVLAMVLLTWVMGKSFDCNNGILVDLCIFGWVGAYYGLINCLETAKEIRSVVVDKKTTFYPSSVSLPPR